MAMKNNEGKASHSKANQPERGASQHSFEGQFVSISGGRLEIADQEQNKTSYALASDALLTCDGVESREGALKAGKRVRVTTQKGNPGTVTSIEWMSNNAGFPELKKAAR